MEPCALASAVCAVLLLTSIIYLIFNPSCVAPPCAFIVPPLAAAAVITGHVARRRIKRHQAWIEKRDPAESDNRRGKTLATLGLVAGYLGVAVTLLPLLVLLSADRMKVPPNESSAIAGLLTIKSVEQSYRTKYQTFTCSLANLGPDGAPSAEHAGLIDEGLASGRKNHYSYKLLNCSANAFMVVALPDADLKNTRIFCVDQTGVLKASTEATPESCIARGIPIE
jgi:hypothetical protein